MALIKQDFGTISGGGTSEVTFVASQGLVPTGSSQVTITIDKSKDYVLFWNLKSTDTTNIYNGMWTIYKGVLELVIGGSNSIISINDTILTIKNAGSSTRGEYILAEIQD